MRYLGTTSTLMAGAALVLACFLTQPAFAEGQQDHPSKSDIEAGKALVFDRSEGNCLACHQIAGGQLTGNVGPELVNMKEKYPDREVLFKRLWDETQFVSDSVMPPFGKNNILTKKQINEVIDFLYTL